MTLVTLTALHRAQLHVDACWQAVIRADSIDADIEAATAYLAARQKLAAIRQQKREIV